MLNSNLFNQSELTIKHHRDKNKCLWDLEERLVKDKDRALHELKTKLEGSHIRG